MFIQIYKHGTIFYTKDKEIMIMENKYGFSYQSLTHNIKKYRLNKKLHNEHGPSIIYNNNNDLKSDYYLNNKRYSKRDWKRVRKNWR